MLIENPEALKIWLTGVLEPLCDADPAALAKYVIALVKKDKSESELRNTCVDQLDVFLQQETKSFVDLLFETLTKKTYLDNSGNMIALNPPVLQTVTLTHTVIPSLCTPNSHVQSPKLDLHSSKKVDNEKENHLDKDRDNRRPKINNLHNRKSRSRSIERDHKYRERSRDKEKDRTRDERKRKQGIRRDRRDWKSRSRSRSRSKSHTNLGVSHSPDFHHGKSRSRSRSTERFRSLNRNYHTTQSLSNTVPENNHGDVDLRVAPQVMQSSLPSSNVMEVSYIGNKKRCRDFDGYCMRGDLCPFDHGNDPVVLEDIALPQVLGFPGQASSNSLPSTSVPPPNIPPHPMVGIPPIRRPPPEPYNPATPSMDTWSFTTPPLHNTHNRVVRPRFQGHQSHSGQQRELINIPMVDSGNIRKNKRNVDICSNGHLDQTRKRPLLEGAKGNRRFDPQNCCLELRKVPRGLNDISHLNNHFSKFGKIVNIQVNFQNDSEAALVIFSSHAEANAAYKSTEAVLNNRFIKVFWHKEEEIKKDISHAALKPSVKERLGVKVLPNPNKVFSSKNEPEKKECIEEKVVFSESNLIKTVLYSDMLKTPVITEEEEKTKNLEAIYKNQEYLAAKEALKKKQEERKKEAVQMRVSIQKRKQELLEKQIQQQKLLLTKLEQNKATLKMDEKQIIIKTIKSLQESIESLRNEIAIQKPLIRSKKETEKELLDAELDLYTCQKEGGDTTELQHRVMLLKRQAKALGVIPGTITNKSKTKLWNGKSRPSMNSFVPSHSTCLDKRPRRIIVIGLEAQEISDALNHFSVFGEIEEHNWQENGAIFHFKNRKDAEVALGQGALFKGRILTLSWYTENLNNIQPSIVDDKPIDENLEEELLNEDIFDEEEEEEVEERSWRR